jgi:Protein of unknown function (DUF1559)
MRLLALTLGVICLAWPPLARASGFEEPAAGLAPFVDAQTTAIVRIDATRVDLPRIKGLLKSLSGERDERGQQADALLSWIPRFVQAGGKELYLIFSMANLQREPFFAIAPLSAGVDAKGVIDALGSVPTFQNLIRVPLGSSVFVGSQQSLDLLKAAKPVARKEIASALEALGAGSAQFILIPTADTRRLVEEVVPTLPPELGGSSVKTLTRGLVWAAVGLDASSNTSMRLVVQSEDAPRALELAYFCKTNLSRLAKLPAVREAVPVLESMEATLVPVVSGDRLTLNLDEATLTALLRPALHMVQDGANRATSTNKMKQIGFALHSYYDVHKTLPPIANFDAAGKPLLSWRVHILPFLGEQKLYEEFHLNEPWDSEHNKKLISRMPAALAVPGFSGSDKGFTTYLAPVAANAIWTGTAAAIKLSEITDGTSNTILLVDAANQLATPWTKPSDYTYDPKNPAKGLAHRHGKFAVVGMADGSVRMIPATIDAKKLLALFTRNGGEVVDAIND